MVPVPLTAKLENIPAASGVYQFKDADEKVLYVGKAINLRSGLRFRQVYSQRASLLFLRGVCRCLLVKDAHVSPVVL